MCIFVRLTVQRVTTVVRFAFIIIIIGTISAYLPPSVLYIVSANVDALCLYFAVMSMVALSCQCV